MTARLLLPVLSGLLILVILGEWLLPDGATARLGRVAPPLTAGHRVATSIASLGAEALAEKILARPLFLPGRRIPPPAVVAAPAAAAKEVPLPRLTGILMAGGVRIAIFQVAGAVKPVAAAVGEAVSAWTVTAIKPDEVTLTGADGEQTLTPSSDASSAADAPEPDADNSAVDPPPGPDQ